MRTNTRQKVALRTHEGGPAKRISALDSLKRTILTCMLGEDTFYESGKSIKARIMEGVGKVNAEQAAQVISDARNSNKLRHAPLWGIVAMADASKSHRLLVGGLIDSVIQRPDEMGELLSLWASQGKKSIPAQMKKGIARSFGKFDEYQLAKYDRAKDNYRLRDILRLVHPKPIDERQSDMWGRLIDGKLRTPDTWETRLSAGAGKKEAFSDLMAQNKLGGLAFLRNLRNMREAGISTDTIKAYMRRNPNIFRNVLPYRFLTAAGHAPEVSIALEEAMLRNFTPENRIKGKTLILVDLSGSMFGFGTNYGKKWLTCTQANIHKAMSLAVIASAMFEDPHFFPFATDCSYIPQSRGLSVARDLIASGIRGGTNTGRAVKAAEARFPDYDRIIVITDEQAHDRVPAPKGKGYVINVAPYKNGVGYGKWIHVDGFSESVFDWIREMESAGYA